MLLADYQSYIDSQEQVSQAYKSPDEWTRMSILNVARIGKFSSDRSIRDYCADIWKTWPVKIQL
jgi:starch phosphorylase